MENFIFCAVAKVEHDLITSLEVYWEDCQTLPFFTKIVIGFCPLITFAKSANIDVWQTPIYVSVNHYV